MNRRLPALILLTWGLCACVVSADFRYYPVEQYDWEGHRGFFLDFEGTRLANLPMLSAILPRTQP